MPDKKEKNSIFTPSVIIKGVGAGVVVLAIAAGIFWLVNSTNPDMVSGLLGTDKEQQETQQPLIDDRDKETVVDSSSSDKNKEEKQTSSSADKEKEREEKAEEDSSQTSQSSSSTESESTASSSSASSSNSTPASTPAASQSAASGSTQSSSSSSSSSGTASSESGSSSSQSSSNSNFGYNSYPTTNDYPGHWSNGPYVLIYDTLVHASASTDSTWVANLKPGDVIQVKQVVKAADGKYWGQVENGWVNLAWGNRLYALNPGQPYYFTQTMAIRDNPSPSAKQTGTLPSGSTRMIYTILYRENEEFWGQLEKNKDQWVCLVDLQNFYVTKA